jgi:hypothetical protein
MRLIALGDELPKVFARNVLGPTMHFLGMMRDPIEECPERLCGPQTRVLESLIDEKLIARL